MKRWPFRRFRLAGLAIAWALAVGFGLAMLIDYEQTPAEPASPPKIWPANSRLARQAGQPTLVMLAHPGCPCTRAALGELEVIAAHTGGRLDIQVVFLRSDGFDDHSGLWRAARAIPGVRVDALSAAEIGTFGVKASGHTLFYDRQGKLRFSGGVTGSRGHAGGNFGRDAIIELAWSDHTATASSPVFGCTLFDSPNGRRAR